MLYKLHALYNIVISKIKDYGFPEPFTAEIKDKIIITWHSSGHNYKTEDWTVRAEIIDDEVYVDVIDRKTKFEMTEVLIFNINEIRI